MKAYLQRNKKISYSDHWATPTEIYDFYENLGYYDPCPLNSTGFDFKVIDKPIFLNPPYSEIVKWIDWAVENWVKTNRHHIILIPSRTDTKYFHKLLHNGCDLEFFEGRLKFGDKKGTAPFPSVLVHLREVIK